MRKTDIGGKNVAKTGQAYITDVIHADLNFKIFQKSLADRKMPERIIRRIFQLVVIVP